MGLVFLKIGPWQPFNPQISSLRGDQVQRFASGTGSELLILCLTLLIEKNMKALTKADACQCVYWRHFGSSNAALVGIINAAICCNAAILHNLYITARFLCILFPVAHHSMTVQCSLSWTCSRYLWILLRSLIYVDSVLRSFHILSSPNQIAWFWTTPQRGFTKWDPAPL